MRAGLVIRNWVHRLLEDDPRHEVSREGTLDRAGLPGYEIKVVGSCAAIGIAYVGLLFWLASLANR